MNTLAQLAGATAVQVLVYDQPLSLDTVTSMGGPLGLAIGGIVGVFVAIPVLLATMNNGKPSDSGMAEAAIALIATPLLFVHFVGGATFTDAILMTLGGAAAAAAVSKPYTPK